MRKEEINRLNAFEMWVWRRIGKVSWMDKRTNEQVLSSMNEKRSLINTIWDRSKNWIGHVVRGDGLMKLVLEGRMEGNRPRGRPRMGMIDDVLDEAYGDMKKKTESRERWRTWKPRTCPWTENDDLPCSQLLALLTPIHPAHLYPPCLTKQTRVQSSESHQ